jgi:hypothetical protein
MWRANSQELAARLLCLLAGKMSDPGERTQHGPENCGDITTKNGILYPVFIMCPKETFAGLRARENEWRDRNFVEGPEPQRSEGKEPCR